jgi:hypothetical protein
MPMNNRLSPAGVSLFGNVPGVPETFGLGSALKQQTDDELEQERKRRALGLSQLSPSGGSPALKALMGLGSMSLGGFGR